MKHFQPVEVKKANVMSRDEIRNFDSFAINSLYIPGVVLMENAGRSCSEVILKHFSDILSPEVSIFCGIGNNGGDGYVIARHLANSQIKVKVIICGDLNKIKGDALINLEILKKMRLPVECLDLEGDIASGVKRFTCSSSIIVDAILGTGLKGQLHSKYAELITYINACSLPIISVDIPSGLDCDTGMPLPVSIEALATVTFVAVKKGFKENPESIQATGKVYVASIGVEP